MTTEGSIIESKGSDEKSKYNKPKILVVVDNTVMRQYFEIVLQKTIGFSQRPMARKLFRK
jgi:ATP-dependent Clp protease adapter protein ClpS